MYTRLTLVALLLYLMVSACSTHNRCLEEITNGILLENYRGVVDTAYRDKLNNARILVLSGKRKLYLTYYPLSVFESISIGDSIVKKSDSTWIAVYRSGAKIGRFYPECDGRKILNVPRSP